MRGSVLIVLLFIMMAMSFLILTTASVVSNHFIIAHNDNSHQKTYFLAEAGVNSAFDDLSEQINKIHEAVLSSYTWDPLTNPSVSIQEGAREHVRRNLGAKLQNILTSLKFLKTNYVREPQLPGSGPNEIIDVQMNITNGYTFDPVAISIVSRSRMGNIKRRIDAVININKVSQVYDSALFDFSLLSGSPIIVHDSGHLTSEGNIYPQGGIEVKESGSINVNGNTYTKESIRIIDSVAAFQGVVTGKEIEASGSSNVVCYKDAYIYKTLKSSGPSSEVFVKGSFYNMGAFGEAGLSALNGGSITIESDIFINGTLTYSGENNSLFGLEELLLPGGVFISGESAGGANADFYFSDEIPDYTARFFTPGYPSLSQAEKADKLYGYLTVPPIVNEEVELYNRHFDKLQTGSITLLGDDPAKGYAAGVIFANGNILYKRNLAQFSALVPDGTPEKYFQSLLLRAERSAGWNYRFQMNEGILVPTKNVMFEDNRIAAIDSGKPVIIVLSENRDITLPPGSYTGIIITNGTIKVEAGSMVDFEGLIAAGGGLDISGELLLKNNKKLIYKLLEENNEPLMNFFKIQKEKPLIEIKSWNERLYNEIIN